MSPHVTAYTSVDYEHDFASALGGIVARNAIDPVTLSLSNPGFAKDRASGSLGLRFSVTPSLQFNLDGSGGTSKAYRFGGGARLTF